jgi:hypothetical protein
MITKFTMMYPEHGKLDMITDEDCILLEAIFSFLIRHGHLDKRPKTYSELRSVELLASGTWHVIKFIEMKYHVTIASSDAIFPFHMSLHEIIQRFMTAITIDERLLI